MNLVIQPAAKSTPEAPMWKWCMWDGNRAMAMGMVADPSEAEAKARTALAAIRGQSHRSLRFYTEQVAQPTRTDANSRRIKD